MNVSTVLSPSGVLGALRQNPQFNASDAAPVVNDLKIVAIVGFTIAPFDALFYSLIIVRRGDFSAGARGFLRSRRIDDNSHLVGLDFRSDHRLSSECFPPKHSGEFGVARGNVKGRKFKLRHYRIPHHAKPLSKTKA